jgi:diguanylate cyclase (GGDEF)-like protein/PAS domain S-box-containing protein
MAQFSTEHLPHLLCVLDFQSQIKKVNSAWQVKLGLMADHLLVTTFTNWVHPDDTAHTQEALSQLYTGKSERVVFETRWRDVNRKYHWLLWAATVSLTENLVYAVGLEMPTQEQSSLASLYQRKPLSLVSQRTPLPPPFFSKGGWEGFSEQRYQTIINGLHEGIIVYSADGKIRLCNPSAEKMLGLVAEQLLGQTDWNLVMVRGDGSDFPKDLHPATVTLRTGKACINRVMGIYKPDGTFHWLILNSQSLQLHSNLPPFAVVVTLTDISERKQAEESLREKAALLSSLFDVVKVGIAVTDEDGRFMLLNPAYCKMYGYRLEELLGQPFTMLLPPPLRQEAAQYHADFLAEKTESYNQWPMQHRNGHVFNCPVTESQLIGRDGKQFKVTVVLAFDDPAETSQAIDLTNNEKWLRLLLRHLPTTVLSLDRKGRLTFTEGLHLELLGLASEKVIGQSILEVNQNLVPLVPDLQRALDGESFEKFIEYAGVTFKTKYMPLLKANKWVGTLVMFHDMTELRVLKWRLKRTIQELEVLASYTSVGLIYLEQQKILHVNQQGAALLGYTPAELLKISADHLCRTANDYIEFQQQAGLQLAVVDTFNTQQWLRRKNGTHICCKLTVKTLKSNRMLWLLEKVTESARTQTRLNLQTALWATASEAILITDTYLRILEANPASAEFMGYTREELVSKSLEHFNTGQQDGQFYEQLLETMRQQGQWQGNIWQRHKNNAVYVCELKLQAYNTDEDDEGVASRYVAILSNKQSRESTFLDPLTHLPSRELFRHYLFKTLAEAQRHKKFSAVLLIGIDDMSGINTKYGCAVGDQLLCTIGQTLTASVRVSDTCARYGGDKFSVNLNEIAKPQDAGLVAQMLLFKLTQPVVLNEKEVQGSVSIGMVVYPEDGDNIDILLDLAQEAMLRAKQQGGGQCCFYNQVLQQQYLMGNQ